MNADIRVYPDKEMKAVDMAEIVDSLQLTDGIIQGCNVEILQNGSALHIDDGRILIRGRLGVVTAGNVELPELEATATCHLTAVCDLAIENPFYISLLTGADLSALEQKKSRVTYFNTGNGVDYVVLGTAVVNPTTHIVSDWTPVDADPVSNKIAFGDFDEKISKAQESITKVSTLVGSTAMGTTAKTVTAAIKELLTKINTNVTNINAAVGRIATLESALGNIQVNFHSVAAGQNYYRAISKISTFVVIIQTWTRQANDQGMYLVSMADAGGVVVPVKTASNMTVEITETTSSATGFVLHIKNGSGATARVTVIKTTGTRLS